MKFARLSRLTLLVVHESVVVEAGDILSSQGFHVRATRQWFPRQQTWSDADVVTGGHDFVENF